MILYLLRHPAKPLSLPAAALKIIIHISIGALVNRRADQDSNAAIDYTESTIHIQLL